MHARSHIGIEFKEAIQLLKYVIPSLEGGTR
jgi:hypothetical protein